MMDNDGYQDETSSYYSNKIEYNHSSLENAMRCLINMQELENIPNFGKLSEQILSSRYTMQSYKDKIDSTFYTDMATSTLSYTIWFLKNNFGEEFSNDVFNYCFKYSLKGTHDLLNDSEGEFANFEGDDSILKNSDLHEAFKLYAYYSEFQLVTGEEEQDVISSNAFSDTGESRLVLKKTENINGGELDFYYVGNHFFDMSEQMLQHDYNISFLNNRMPGDVLNACTSNTGRNDIITLTYDYAEYVGINNGIAAYAMPYCGNIVVKGNNFCDSICHEIGHLFDVVNEYDLGIAKYTVDYNNGNDGIWDRLAKKYADSIETIRRGADISCGYNAEGMRDKHYEFYAEAFQLYFYSEETRAALPEEVRKRIEKEIEKYA